MDDVYTVILSASYKINKAKATHEIFLNLDNITNTKGRLSEYYDEDEPNSTGYLTHSNKCCFILSGCVRRYYLMNGEEKTTFFYTEGQSIYSIRSAAKHYLSCVEETTLTVLTDENQEELFRRFPRFEALSRVALEEELTNYQEMLATYITHSPKERYLYLLKFRPDLLNRVPHYQLASYLGIKPESLSRIQKRIMLK